MSYTAVMKWLSIILALAIAVSPLASHACATDGFEVSHSEAGMGHDGHGADAPTAGHDCCAGDAPVQSSDCGSAGHCPDCLAGSPGLATTDSPITNALPVYRMALDGSTLAPSHASPPFRPPANPA